MATIISKADITSMFDDLIMSRSSREAVAARARDLREAEDEGALVYDPPQDEHILWDAILYLEGADLKETPEDYLHDDANFIEYRRLLGF